MRGRGVLLALVIAAGAGCSPAFGTSEPQRASTPSYLGAQAELLDDTLLSVTLRMSGVTGAQDIAAYADCVASGVALQQGYSFARHVRTNLADEGGIWLADAVYTLSPALPKGLRTLDADVVAATCRENGIPLV